MASSLFHDNQRITLLGQKGGRRGNKLLHPVHSRAFILGEEDYELALSVSSCDHPFKTTLLLITNTFFRSKDLKFHWILKTWQRTTLQLEPQTEINFWLSPSAKQCRKSVLGRKVFTNIKKAPWLKSSKSHRQYPNRVKGNLKRISSNSVTGFSGELSIQPKIPEISVGTSSGMDHFGLVRPEFEGAWSTLTCRHFGRSERNVPFHLTKLFSSDLLSTALLYTSYKNNN